jgi:hypothetical protein
MAVPASSSVYSRPLISALRRFCLVAALIVTSSTTGLAAKWAPVPAEELASTKPQVDPEAGAEILFRSVTITHKAVDEFERVYHVRAKIYSERGLEEFTKIELPYDAKTDIRHIAVRTIKPDGQIIELTKKDIYDREIIKAGKERVKVKSFSPAGVQPGSIVEYTFTEIEEGWSWYVSMYFQSSLPARLVQYKFRPIDGSTLASYDRARLTARVLFLNCPNQTVKPDAHGHYAFEMKNVPAAKEEPNQPPRLSCQSSIIVCYSLEKQDTAKAFWAKQGEQLHERMLKETKPTKLVKTTLDELVIAGDSEEQKLRKIYDFCRTKIAHRYSAASSFTREQREKFKPNETASDTLKAGSGSGEDLNTAFVALARAAGFDARYAAAGDRSFILFDAKLTEPFMVSDLIAAVKNGDQWQYFDPGALYLPYATPYWRNTHTCALIAAPEGALPVPIRASPAPASPQKRKASFTLDANGTLEGDVTIEYEGHQAVARKFALDHRTVAERETYVRDEIRQNLKLAEATDIKVENASDPTAPLKISFHLRVPEYADRTGSRLFFQPAVFQKNEAPLFTEMTRRTDLIFSFCYVDSDEIRITPPEGFELEEGSSPGSFDLGDLGSYQLSIGIAKKTGTLVYRRDFALRAIAVSAQHYASVRDAFEEINKRDAHTLTLRRKASATNAPSSAAEAPPAASIKETAPSSSL